VAKLKLSDIDSNRMVIHIEQGKGRRDRDIPMTPIVLEVLREYRLPSLKTPAKAEERSNAAS